MELRCWGCRSAGTSWEGTRTGEAFHPETDIWMKEGDTVPVTYYHGFGPDDPWDWQEAPAVIGTAKLVEAVENEGFWFLVRLDEQEELALRVKQAIEEGREVRARAGRSGTWCGTGRRG